VPLSRRFCHVLLGAGLTLPPMIVLAQDDAGGLRMTFGLSQRFETTENLALDTDSAGRTTQSATNLSFALITETRTQRLAIDASTDLRFADGPDKSSDNGLADPRFGLSYTRAGANASLTFNASLRNDDIAFVRPLEDFLTPDGEIDLPDDLADLSGTGTRRNATADLALRWGDGGPLGFGITAKVDDINYIDSSAGLIDSRRMTLGATMRVALDPATDLTLGLRQSQFTDDEGDDSNTLGFDAAFARARPNGSISATFLADDSEGGTRLGLSFGRSLDLPRGSLSATLGLGRSAAGNNYATGKLDLRQDLPRGQFNASLERGFSADSDDNETVLTSIALGYNQSLTPLTSFGVTLRHADSEETETGLNTRNTTLSASITYALTEDWGLTTGYTHALRDEDSVGNATSGTAFLTLDRSFSLRF
jgi:hypothetical protein